MKSISILAAILILPCVAMAEGKPDGVLETDNVMAYGYLDHYSLKGYYSTDYSGFGLGINKSVVGTDKFGVNVGFNYEHIVDNSSYYYDDYENNSYTPSVTAYLKNGMFLPFVTAEYTYSDSSYYDGSHGRTSWIAAVIGVEMHVMPGWYVTPRVTLWDRVHSSVDYGSKTFADFALESGYWLTNRIAVFANANYRNAFGARDEWINFGVRMSF